MSVDSMAVPVGTEKKPDPHVHTNQIALMTQRRFMPFI